MPRSAPLQPRFDLFFEIANDKLGRTKPLYRYHDVA
jgi:hypothetical protein